MKKCLFILLFGILLFTSSCVYLGLSSQKIKIHTQNILKQVEDFSYDTYWGYTFYPKEDGTNQFVDLAVTTETTEVLIQTDDWIVYNKNGEEVFFDKTTKEKTSYQKDPSSYPFYEEIDMMIQFIKSFDGTTDDVLGRKRIDQDGEDYLDELEYMYKDIPWKYDYGGSITFYVTENTSEIRKIYCASDELQFGKSRLFATFYMPYMLKDTELEAFFGSLILEE